MFSCNSFALEIFPKQSYIDIATSSFQTNHIECKSDFRIKVVALHKCTD